MLRRYIEMGLPGLAEWVRATVDVLRNGHKVLLFGNGGSAADAQHLAAEFVNRYLIKNRAALPAIALTTDTSALTCIANDLGIEKLFARQVEALATRGDMAVGISTSGNSANVLKALTVARARGCVTVGLTGQPGGRMLATPGRGSPCDLCLVAPDDLTPIIQQFHITIGHLWVDLVETTLEGKK